MERRSVRARERATEKLSKGGGIRKDKERKKVGGIISKEDKKLLARCLTEDTAKNITNVHLLKRNTLRRGASDMGMLIFKTYNDAKNQTPAGWGGGIWDRKGEEEEEEEEEGDNQKDEEEGIMKVKCDACPVCLCPFRLQKRQALVAKCGHILCKCCFSTLSKNSRERQARGRYLEKEISCPLCRTKSPPDEYRKLIYTHFEGFAIAERRKMTDIAENLKNDKLCKILESLNELIEFERARVTSLPKVCHNSTIRKRREEIVDNIEANSRLNKFLSMKSNLTDCIQSLEKMLGFIQPASSNLILNISKLLAREVTKRAVSKIKNSNIPK